MNALFTAVDPLLSILRPHLTPITQNLPSSISSFGISQVGAECYRTTVENLDLTSSPECSKLLVSKAIGTGIVGLSVFVKVPQLLKLISSKSAAGVSFSSYLLEIAAQTITLAYNTRQGNPISTYGEIAVLAVQNVIVAMLVLEFQGRRNMAAAFLVAVATAGAALFKPEIVSKENMQLLQAATIPLGLMSKVPQIWTIAKEGSTGQLSAFAVCIGSMLGVKIMLMLIYRSLTTFSAPLLGFSRRRLRLMIQ